jgi:ligand-binding sensor domain-containing protein
MIGKAELDRVLFLMSWWLTTIKFHNAIDLFAIYKVAKGRISECLLFILATGLKNLLFLAHYFSCVDTIGMHLKGFENASFKKIRFILRVLAFGLCFFISPSLQSQNTGYKYLNNYTAKDYDHQPQNWGMVQAKNGTIYVANHGGVLEFDGVSFRIIGIPDYATVRSLAIDETGIIYVGGIGEIGYLAPNEKGTLTYVSLRGYLPENQRNFTDVWKTYAVGENVYFYTSAFLFRWNSEKSKFVVLPHRYSSFLICGERLFIQREEAGLEQIVQIKNPTLVTVSVDHGEQFLGKEICIMAPYSNRKILIGTQQNGLYIYDGKTTTPFPTEVDDYLKKSRLYHGIRLSSDDFALATLLGGLIIINHHGRLKYIFDKPYGLQDEQVYYVFEDNQENLWLCLSKGISKIEYASPISTYDERSNLSGLVISVAKYHNELYAGTTTGLYYLESPLKFRHITGISTYCWDLLPTEDSLLVATSEGVFEVKKNTKRNVIKGSSFVLLPLKGQSGRIWCGTDNGLVILTQKNGRWIEEYRYKNIKQSIRSIAEDKSGHLWLVTAKGDVVEVDFQVSSDEPVLVLHDNSPGLSATRIHSVVEAAEHVMFATYGGIFRFDARNKRFIPDQTLGTEFAGGPGPKSVFRISEDKKKNIWFHSQGRNYHAVSGPAESFKIDPIPFRRIPTTFQVNAIYPDPDGKIVWFATHGGLIRYDTTAKKNYGQDFQTLVRMVWANEDLIFAGYKNKTGKHSIGPLSILEYKKRNLRFDFAAPYFGAETETQYQSFLEGYDDNWSAWSRDTRRNFTNLDPGLYIFRVRAKNVFGYVGDEDAFRFKILPSWYKTWWAFLFYGIGFFLLVFLIVKLKSRTWEREKHKLEQIVKERINKINGKDKQRHSFMEGPQMPPLEILTEPKNSKKQIFISYSHSDKKFVKKLTIDLRNAGVRVWVDEKKIKVGDSISQKVEEGIYSCDFFCLIISRHSAKSKWVDREYRTALSVQLSSRNTLIILPLLIQDVKLPFLLKDIKYADFSESYDSGFMQLLDAIK